MWCWTTERHGDLSKAGVKGHFPLVLLGTVMVGGQQVDLHGLNRLLDPLQNLAGGEKQGDMSRRRRRLGFVKRKLSRIDLERQDEDRKDTIVAFPRKLPIVPFPAGAAGCSLSPDYSFMAEVFLGGILPKQWKSETVKLITYSFLHSQACIPKRASLSVEVCQAAACNTAFMNHEACSSEQKAGVPLF